MIQLISSGITDQLIKNGIIVSDEKELYTYGLQQGMIMLFNIAITVFIGIALEMVWQSLIFMIAYMPLRSYAGGYHAKTQLYCYLFSISLIVLALLGIKLLPWSKNINIAVTLIASTIIIVLAPIEDINKPLHLKEKLIFKKITRIILVCLIVGVVLFDFLGQSQISICITMAISSLSIMLLLGKNLNK